MRIGFAANDTSLTVGQGGFLSLRSLATKLQPLGAARECYSLEQTPEIDN